MCFTRIYGFIFCDPKVINRRITSTVINSLNDVDLATGLYTFPDTATGIPENNSGTLINQQTAGFCRQIAICCGSHDDEVHAYCRSYYKLGESSEWPIWQIINTSNLFGVNGRAVMYATSQGGFVIEFRVPSEYTGPYYVWKLGFEADTIKIWKSDGSMQYVGMKRDLEVLPCGMVLERWGRMRTLHASNYTGNVANSLGVILTTGDRPGDQIRTVASHNPTSTTVTPYVAEISFDGKFYVYNGNGSSLTSVQNLSFVLVWTV